MIALKDWETVNEDCGGTSRSEYIRTANIAQWATKINASVRSWHDHTDRGIFLIQVPGAGSGLGLTERPSYTLAPSIPSEGIRIHPKAQG